MNRLRQKERKNTMVLKIIVIFILFSLGAFILLLSKPEEDIAIGLIGFSTLLILVLSF